VAQALARATSQISRDLRVRAIVVVTRHGATASVMSASRPAAPVVAVTADSSCARTTALLWGVRPLQVPAARLDDPIPLAREVVARLGLGEPGQTVLVVQGFRFNPAESVPSLTVVTL
jgi:pyruvate kinase